MYFYVEKGDGGGRGGEGDGGINPEGRFSEKHIKAYNIVLTVNKYLFSSEKEMNA